MSFIYNLKNGRDLLEKSRRELIRLEEAILEEDDEKVGDATFNFVVTTFHIKDWIIGDKSNSLTKEEVEKFVNETQHLSICRDLCNSGKHFVIDRYQPETENMELSSGPSIVLRGPNDKKIQIPNRKYKIKTKEYESFELMEFAIHCFQKWDEYFNEKDLNSNA